MYGPGYGTDALEKKAAGVYAQSRVFTASPGELVLMAYDEAIKSMKMAREEIRKKDLMAANRAITKAEDLVAELWSAVNPDAGGLSRLLDSIYDYVYRSLVAANARKDPDILDRCIKVMQELRQGWADVAGAKNGADQG